MSTAKPQNDAPGGSFPILPLLAGWLVPGAGHFLLGQRRRAVIFFGLILFSFLLGCWLEGKLYVVVAEQPLSRLATIASMAAGLPYLIARYLYGYSGDLLSAGYEYGTAFLLTAGLMNFLAILDVWDNATVRGGEE